MATDETGGTIGLTGGAWVQELPDYEAGRAVALSGETIMSRKPTRIELPLWLYGVFVLFGICLAIIVVATYFSPWGPKDEQAWSKWGQLGDYVGGLLNPVFGFLGFLALLLTLWFQSKELQ